MPQSRSVKGFLDEVNCGEKTHTECGLHHPVDCGYMNEQEKAS